MKGLWIIIALAAVMGLAGCYSPNPAEAPAPALTANNGGAPVEGAPTATVLTIIAPPVTSLPEAIATSVPPTLMISTAEPVVGTASVDIISTSASLPGDLSSSGCQIPAGWVPYTLQQGDTLFGLSIDLETTIDEIARANCLDDPDNLTAGEVIYLPGAGAAPAPENPAAPQAGGVMGLSITPATAASNVQVLPTGSVQFRVSNAPAGAVQVAFFLHPGGDEAAEQRIGTDTDLSDGATLTFTVNDSLFGDVFAAALDVNGAEIERTAEQRIVADG